MKFKFFPILLGILTASLSSFTNLKAKNVADTTTSVRYCEHSYLICTVTDEGTTLYGTWNEGPTSPEIE